MSLVLSTIPAYLRYACGHSAMVSLPRIKGESARDRERRITTEKNSANDRRCDFCGPALTIAEVLPAPLAVVAAPAKPVAAAPAQPVAAAPVKVAAAAPVKQAAPAPVKPAAAAPVRPAAPAPVKPAAAEPVKPAAPAPRREPVRVAPAPAIQAQPAPTRVHPKPRPTPAPPRHNGHQATRQFRIVFLKEVVLEADTIHSALARAEALGATEITEIAHAS